MEELAIRKITCGHIIAVLTLISKINPHPHADKWSQQDVTRVWIDTEKKNVELS